MRVGVLSSLRTWLNDVTTEVAFVGAGATSVVALVRDCDRVRGLDPPIVIGPLVWSSTEELQRRQRTSLGIVSINISCLGGYCARLVPTARWRGTLYGIRPRITSFLPRAGSRRDYPFPFQGAASPRSCGRGGRWRWGQRRRAATATIHELR